MHSIKFPAQPKFSGPHKVAGLYLKSAISADVFLHRLPDVAAGFSEQNGTCNRQIPEIQTLWHSAVTSFKARSKSKQVSGSFRHRNWLHADNVSYVHGPAPDLAAQRPTFQPCKAIGLLGSGLGFRSETVPILLKQLLCIEFWKYRSKSTAIDDDDDVLSCDTVTSRRQTTKVSVERAVSIFNPLASATHFGTPSCTKCL